MKVYVIMAHKSAELLFKLVSTLDDNRSRFFIHLDSKYPSDEYVRLLNDNVHVTFVSPRLNIRWGGSEYLFAIINTLQAVSKAVNDFTHVIMLSGQDFPIKSNSEITGFLEKNIDQSFMEFFSLPNNGWGRFGGLERYQKIHLQHVALPFYIQRLQGVFNKLFEFNFKRKMPLDLKTFGGSDWFILNKNAFDYVIKFVNEHKSFSTFFKYALHPNELFFQTILLNADKEISGNIVNDNMKYIDWSRPQGPYPAILTKNDMKNMFDSGKLFARKFDLDIDPNVINELQFTLGA